MRFRTTKFSSLLACLSIILPLALTGVGISEIVQTGAKAGSFKLTEKDRYRAHLSTDKPIYRPGETLYARAAVLRASDRVPSAKPQDGQSNIQIIGPKGDVIAGGMPTLEHGVYAFAWQVPSSLAGGLYTLKMISYDPALAPTERKFEIRAFRQPRIKTQIKFLRDGYGPGDNVVATLEATRAEGGFPSGAPVEAVARVDEKEVYRGPALIDATGRCSVRFNLPEKMERGEGTLVLIIKDGNAVETASKTIPILLQTLDLAFYPEGGDLVAGLAGRVYIEARTPAGKPADLAGVIVDDRGREAAHLRTEHEGRGRFELNPEAGRSYALRIKEPAGITKEFPLPEVKSAGAMLRSKADIFDANAPIQLSVSSSIAGPHRVTLSIGEVESKTENVTLSPGQSRNVTITPPKGMSGIFIATLWSADGRPLAERLVFRRPQNSLRVSITPDADQYIPAGRVGLKIKTTDERGQPLGAVLGLAVTDDAVLEMIDKREQTPRLPAMALLEADVRELADAHVYLDEKNSKAPLALDLLLGTQGWRRFAFVDPAAFLVAKGDAARRVIAVGANLPRQMPVPAAAGMAGARWIGGPINGLEAKGDVFGVNFRNPAADAANHEKAGRIIADPGDVLIGNLELNANPGIFVFPEGFANNFQLEAPGLAAGRGGRAAASVAALAPASRNDLLPVRVYAHQTKANRLPNRPAESRTDFTETLYWNASIQTDSKTGEASVSFDLSDAVTSFRVTSDAFSSEGALGTGSAAINSVKPLFVEPKIPLEVTAGDKIILPVGIVNGTAESLPGSKLIASAGKLDIPITSFDLGARERARRLITLDTAALKGEVDIALNAAAGRYSDDVHRKLIVMPGGFPVEIAGGGVIEPNGSALQTIEIPEEIVNGSLKAQIALHPSPLASLNSALAGLIRQPNGCFEQTSSTNYPLIMAQQYFMSHPDTDPALIQKSAAMLDAGYKKLTGFEVSTKGYEWFGESPGHEALSAYAVLEFTDMAKIYPVDNKMLGNTRAWLLQNRDGKGGFKRERRALHTWIADADCSNAYITWSLLESGEKNLDAEVRLVKESAPKSANSYVYGLAANILALSGNGAGSREMMDRLSAKQTKEGWVDGATTSIVGSAGEALKIETTALATLAWLRDEKYTPQVELAMKWLAEVCKGGRFGSTQSTVLALRAIIDYDKARSKPKAPGSARLFVDGAPAGDVAFTAETKGSIEFADFSNLVLKSGRHTIELRMKDGSSMPFTMAISMNTATPNSSKEAVLMLDVELTNSKIKEGESTEALVRVENRADKVVPSPVAIIGMPGGLEVRHDQLKELVKSGRIAAYEVRGREVVLYWRSLEPGAKVNLSLSLIAAVPGKYTGPASRAYLYYTDEFKMWSPGLVAEITPDEKKSS